MTTDAEFTRSVRYFWEEKGSPERYCDWDVDRCRRLMPAFYEAWSKIQVYTKLASMAAENEAMEEG